MLDRRTQLSLGVSIAALPFVGGSVQGGQLLDPNASAPVGPPVLHDNGVPDIINGYSNATEGVFGLRRTLLDDFVVPTGETWTLERFEWTHGIFFGLLDPPFGTGAEISLWTDADGAPDTPFQILDITNYSEIQTGRLLFTTEETISWVDFEPVVLTGGHYWIENTIICEVNNFWYTASPVQNSECWINYEDLGFHSGTEEFGVPADLAWRLMGQREALGDWACCFPSGNCVEMTVFDCEAQEGLFQGIGTKCDLVVCGLPGACCFLDNTCVQISGPFCAFEGGDYAGIGVPCGGTLCNVCGEFGARVEFGLFASRVGLADFDGDLDLDMVSTLNDEVLIFLNEGDGTFAAPIPFPLKNARRLAISDLDNDLDNDLAVTGGFDDPVTVLFNDGNASFAPGGTYENPGNARSIRLGDLTGDFVPDMAIPNSVSDVISVWRNVGGGFFGTRRDHPLESPGDLDFVDIDGDLDLDIVASSAETTDPLIAVLLNNGVGIFTRSADIEVIGNPSAIVAADFDGDLDPDLAVIIAFSVRLLRNDGGTFIEHGIYPVASMSSLTAGDVNGDLSVDLVVAQPNADMVSVLLNKGDGTFHPFDDYPADSASSTAIGDVDGDLAVDLALSGSLSILFNDCPPCAEDLDASGAVDFADILAILAAWGNAGGPEDLDGSGSVDFGDLLVILGNWGPC